MASGPAHPWPEPSARGFILTLLAFGRHLLFCAGLAGVSALAVRWMVGVGVLDTPNSRSAHARPTPKGGGVGIVLAFVLGMAVLYGFAGYARIADPAFRGVIAAAVAMAAVAWGDDTRQWPFWAKLGAQVAAALVVVASGLRVDWVNVPGVGTVGLGWAAAPLTVAWILYVTNAMNFIDGLNGLAAGASALCCAALAALAAAHGGWFVYFASLVLMAGLAGFLPFNFPRARIFMGDVGSQFCGFVLAVLGVAAARLGDVELSMLLVPMLLAGILWDVGFTLARRQLAGDRITEGHRGHLYQLAHRAGVPAAAVTLVHWGFVAWGAACCTVFLATAGAGKAGALALVAAPQAAWTAWVLRRARQTDIGRW